MAGVTGHEELFPHQESVLVAKLVEVVALHNSAAPQAQEIESALGAQPQHRRHPLVIVLQHGFRNPVAAADENRLPVHHEHLAAVRGFAGGPDFPDAEAGAAFVAEHLPVKHLQLEGVKRLLSLAQGPPEGRIVYMDGFKRHFLHLFHDIYYLHIKHAFC